MPTRDRAVSPVQQPVRLTRSLGRTRLALLGGGTDGNEELTAVTGVLLIVMLAVIGVTILRIQQLIWLHLFVGLLLIGPVGLKLASTGYRFTRYYTDNPAYRHKGPPAPILRGIAPIVTVTTVAVFLTGLLLLFGGAGSRDRWLELHKISFIVWIVFTALHVLGHLPGLGRSMRATRGGGVGGPADGAPGASMILRSPGEAGRWLALIGALVGGLVLAIALLGDFGSWTHAAALHHQHDG